MPHEYARVVALSRVKGGRIAHVSQVVGDLVLRVPNVTNESAFALEVIVTGRRYRLDVLKSDLESVHTKEEITELSRDAESELECSGCGRRWAPRCTGARINQRPAARRSAASRRRSGRSRKKVTTARIAFLGRR